MSEEKQEITELHTACLGCVFAINDKQTQVGCDFDRLEVYKKNGADIVKAYDEHNNEFDVINMRICMYKRGKEWGVEVPKKEWKETVEKELRIKYHVMVYFNDGNTIEDLDATLGSLDIQKSAPRMVSILNRRKDISQKDLVTHLSSLDLKNIEWRLQTFFDADMHSRECVDMVIDNTKYDFPILFYTSFHAGFVAPESLSDELQAFFVKDMQRAAYAYPTEEGNGELVNSILHLKHAGNCFNIPIIEKIKEFEEGAEDFIMSIEDICPSLKQ